jgi:hypothetical protein
LRRTFVDRLSRGQILQIQDTGSWLGEPARGIETFAWGLALTTLLFSMNQ